MSCWTWLPCKRPHRMGVCLRLYGLCRGIEPNTLRMHERHIYVSTYDTAEVCFVMSD